MRIRNRFARKVYLSTFVLGLCLFSIGVSSATADGPATPGSLPGGVVVNDSDTTGEQWGRMMGRTIDFSVNDLTNFTSLTWGAVGTNAVTLAFDGVVDAPSETLVLGSVGVGVAQWNGTATIPLSIGGSLGLPARFTLTIVDGANSPVALATDPGGNQPGLDVLLANGQFTATLLFEVQHNGSHGVPGGWTPVLDLFDSLPTIPGPPPNTTGPVMTGFNSGFFFEAIEGLTLEEHDESMHSQTEMIKDALQHLTTDAINRLTMLGQEHGDIHSWLNSNHVEIAAGLDQVLMTLNNLQIPTDVASSADVMRIQDDVQSAKDDLQNILLILFGLGECPPDQPLCPPDGRLQLFATPESVQMVKDDVQSLLGKVMDIQDTLLATTSMPEIEVQIAEVSHGDSGKARRWILTTTINGKLVDVDLVKSTAITVDKANPAITDDVTGYAVPVSLGPGLLDVSMTLPKSAKKARVFQFDVFFDDGEVMAHGSALAAVGKGGDDDD